MFSELNKLPQRSVTSVEYSELLILLRKHTTTFILFSHRSPLLVHIELLVTWTAAKLSRSPSCNHAIALSLKAKMYMYSVLNFILSVSIQHCSPLKSFWIMIRDMCGRNYCGRAYLCHLKTPCSVFQVFTLLMKVGNRAGFWKIYQVLHSPSIFPGWHGGLHTQ